MMKKLFFTLLMSGVALTILLSANAALACTTILVDKDSSEDGSYIAGRNDDGNLTNMPQFSFHPRQKNHGGTLNAEDFVYPLPEESLAYTSASKNEQDGNNINLKLPGESGFNEYGVGVSATETIFGSKKALQADPYVKTGINETALTDVLLSRVHTAKEGILLLGKIVETMGAAEGCGVAIVDKNELWYFENGSGHQWMATRVPSKNYFVSANQGRLQDFDFKDTDHFLSSQTLISFAQEHGLYDPSKKFNFKDVYIKNELQDATYNYPRVWVLQHLYNPELKTTPADSWTADAFKVPTQKLSLNDVKQGLRNHYEGTAHDPYFNENPKEPYRPIAVFRVEQSHILQVRPNLPSDIGCITYISIGMQPLSPYIPYYQGLGHYLPYYDTGTSVIDDFSVVWKYRRLQALAFQNFKKYYPLVLKAYTQFENKIAEQQKVLEKQYLALYKTDLKQAKLLIQEFEDRWMKEGLDLTEILIQQLLKDLNIKSPTNEYYAKIITDVNKKYPFHGA